MERTQEDSHHETESHQLLPSIPSAATRANSVRSQHASISDVSSQSISDSVNNCETTDADRFGILGNPQWIPLALRWSFMAVTTALSFILVITVLSLLRYSHENQGLGSEESAMVGWKFVPTLVAVIYTQMTAMILGAVKRTEPFARMARPIEQVPVARYTLLEKSKPWWTTLVHGSQKQRNGGSRSYAAILSCAVFILAILGISPISAALLTSREAQMQHVVDMHCLSPNKTIPLTPQVERATYLRTTGAILQNYSTSPWVTGEYFISPFWPSEHIESMWAYQAPNPRIWEMLTPVYRNDFICRALQVQSQVNRYNYTYDRPSTTVQFSSEDGDDGCQLNITRDYLVNTMGPIESAIWTDTRDLDKHLMASHSSVNDRCPMHEIVLISPPWWGGTFHNYTFNTVTARAYVCRSDHVMATVPVRASSSQAGLEVSFDEGLFNERRTPVGSETFNPMSFRDIYSRAEWASYVASEHFFIQVEPEKLDGAASLLGSRYGQNVSSMINDPKLLEVAAQMRRYFFAEILRTTLSNPLKTTVESCSGTQYATSRRVTVNWQVASLLCALLTVSTCGLLALVWFTRLDRRPLNLRRDPSSILGIVDLVNIDSSALWTFKSMNVSTRKAIKADLASTRFATSSNRLVALVDRTTSITTGQFTTSVLLSMSTKPFKVQLKYQT